MCSPSEAVKLDDLNYRVALSNSEGESDRKYSNISDKDFQDEGQGLHQIEIGSDQTAEQLLKACEAEEEQLLGQLLQIMKSDQQRIQIPEELRMEALSLLKTKLKMSSGAHEWLGVESPPESPLKEDNKYTNNKPIMLEDKRRIIQDQEGEINLDRCLRRRESKLNEKDFDQQMYYSGERGDINDKNSPEGRVEMDIQPQEVWVENEDKNIGSYWESESRRNNSGNASQYGQHKNQISQSQGQIKHNYGQLEHISEEPSQRSVIQKYSPSPYPSKPVSPCPSNSPLQRRSGSSSPEPSPNSNQVQWKKQNNSRVQGDLRGNVSSNQRQDNQQKDQFFQHGQQKLIQDGLENSIKGDEKQSINPGISYIKQPYPFFQNGFSASGTGSEASRLSRPLESFPSQPRILSASLSEQRNSPNQVELISQHLQLPSTESHFRNLQMSPPDHFQDPPSTSTGRQQHHFCQDDSSPARRHQPSLAEINKIFSQKFSSTRTQITGILNSPPSKKRLTKSVEKPFSSSSHRNSSERTLPHLRSSSSLTKSMMLQSRSLRSPAARVNLSTVAQYGSSASSGILQIELETKDLIQKKQGLLEDIKDIRKAIAAEKKEENSRKILSDSYSSRITTFRAKSGSKQTESLSRRNELGQLKSSTISDQAKVDQLLATNEELQQTIARETEYVYTYQVLINEISSQLKREQKTKSEISQKLTRNYKTLDALQDKINQLSERNYEYFLDIKDSFSQHFQSK